MLRATLPLALLLAACGAPVVQPLSEAKRREPDVAAAKDRPATEAPTQPPAPPPEPYTRAGDPKDQREELRFWGFSADSQRFAFETFYAGPGATKCEGEATLFVVDSETDSFVEGTPLVLKHKEPDAERCDPPDLRGEMDRHREQVLHRHGIVVGTQGEPILARPEITTRGTGRTSTIEVPAGKPLHAVLEVLHGEREQAEKGAAYKLTLHAGEGTTPLVVEDGARRRPWIWDYSLDEGLVFVAPDRRHLAIVIATTQVSFEGDRHGYKSNGLKLPDGW